MTNVEMFKCLLLQFALAITVFGILTFELFDVEKVGPGHGVQGSGIGPTLFVICIIDLKPIWSTNYVTKYADDASLLVPEKCDIDIMLEIQNVFKWATNNNLTINMAKTKELIFHRPNARNYLLPAIERVIYAKLRWVWLQEDLGMKEHVNNVMLLCNQRTYLIIQRKRQGLTQEPLLNAFDEIILSHLFDAVPARRGNLKSAEIDCLQGLLDKAKRWKLICREYNIVDLLDKCDRTLLKSSLCLSHVVNHLYPDKRHHTHLMSISTREHGFSLPQLKYLLSW